MPMKAARGVTLPSAVVLRGGRGAKGAHNGQLAHLGASKGGWTAVVLGGQTVKWRTGHWDEATAVAAVAPHAVSDIFSWLPEAVALEILAYLSLPELCRARTVSRALNGLPAFTECSLRDGMPAGYGVRPCRQLDFARMLVAKKAQLRTMHIDFGSAEIDVVLWLLQECDCSRLETVKLRCQGVRGQITRAGYRCGVPGLIGTGLIDLSVKYVPVDRQMTGVDVRSSTRRSITGALAQFCPALKSLSLPKGVGTLDDPDAPGIDDTPGLTNIKSLCRLEASFLEVDDINFAVSELPCLTHLTLLGGNQYSLHNGLLEFESDSLQYVDVTESTKHLYFKRLACPSLRTLRCTGGAYGNGVRLVVSVRKLVDPVVPPGAPFQLIEVTGLGSPFGGPTVLEIEGRACFADHRARVEVPTQCQVVFGEDFRGVPFPRVQASWLAELRLPPQGTLEEVRRVLGFSDDADTDEDW